MMWIFQILMMMMKVSIKEAWLTDAAVRPLLNKYTVPVPPFSQN